jgi:hypothetical protein
MMRMIRSQPGFGSLGLDGELGYGASMTGDRVMLPPRVTFGESLSAHAPSEAVLELTEQGSWSELGYRWTSLP